MVLLKMVTLGGYKCYAFAVLAAAHTLPAKNLHLATFLNAVNPLRLRIPCFQ